MKQLTANVFVETELKGANHGIVTTSDGIVLIDTPHKPSEAMRLRGKIERHGRLRPHQHRAARRSLDRQCVLQCARRRAPGGEIANPRH
jgi:hypothetical protein